MPSAAELDAATTTIKNLVRAGSNYRISDHEVLELARGALRAAEIVREREKSNEPIRSGHVDEQ